MALGNPEQAVEAINLLPPDHASQIASWNKCVPEATDECIHDLIAAACCGRPDAPAVCGWDKSFTYRALDDISTRMGSHLVDKYGIQVGNFVALCFEKSAWTDCSLPRNTQKPERQLSFWTPETPQTRLCNMIGQVNAALVLCSSATKATVKDWDTVSMVV